MSNFIKKHRLFIYFAAYTFIVFMLCSCAVSEPYQPQKPLSWTTSYTWNIIKIEEKPLYEIEVFVWVVKKHDTLIGLAKEIEFKNKPNASYQDVLKWVSFVATINNISNEDLIFPEQKLFIPIIYHQK